MKKSFIYYLSSVAFVSLFSISSVDAGLFSSKSKEPKEKPPTVVSQIFGETNMKETVNAAKGIQSGFSDARAKVNTSISKVRKLATDKKTFSENCDVVSPQFILVIFSSVSEYMDLTSVAFSYILEGIELINKAKKEGDKSEIQGRKTLEQGIKMLELAKIYYPTFKAQTVILQKFCKSRKSKINNPGEVKQSFKDLQKLIGDRKKFIGSAKGIITQIDAFIEKFGTLSENTTDEELQILFEDCKNHTKISKNIVEAFSQLLNALIEYFGNNTEPLMELAKGYNKDIKGDNSIDEEDEEEEDTKPKRKQTSRSAKH